MSEGSFHNPCMGFIKCQCIGILMQSCATLSFMWSASLTLTCRRLDPCGWQRGMEQMLKCESCCPRQCCSWQTGMAIRWPQLTLPLQLVWLGLPGHHSAGPRSYHLGQSCQSCMAALCQMPQYVSIWKHHSKYVALDQCPSVEAIQMPHVLVLSLTAVCCAELSLHGLLLV